MFIIENIEKKFKKQKVLDGINLVFKAGRCVGILGSNGSGKTTLLSILAGVRKCDNGKFYFDNGKSHIDLLKDTRHVKIAYMPQNNPLFEELSVWDNLRLYYNADDLKKNMEKDGILKKMGVDSYIKKKVQSLSGGMKRRVTFCAALSQTPSVLLLDEPTSAMDRETKQVIYDYIRHYIRDGGTVLMVTHDTAELEICDEYYYIENGILKNGNQV